ncbi:sensor histidine kinase [Flammeovirga sp. EKP202]|uniref:sensor histidine kinase n=1 Tax=Flammeovirga sp. EKP202 TaxID=2770592 RepID=UPI00165ED635|nr:histidine kinase [Flammeovirga sp. EKP202]MBD0403138.1 histidine kinase [Flammeovirga sp. EKP202]
MQKQVNQVPFILTTLVWLLLFSMPLLFGDYENGIKWSHIQKIWAEYAVLLMVYLINHFYYMPKFFFKDKKVKYFILVGISIIALSVVVYYLHTYFENQRLPRMRPREHFSPMHPPHHEIIRQKEFVPPYANFIILSILLIGFDSSLLFFSKWTKSEQNKLKAEKENIANKMAFLKTQISPHFFMNTLNNIHALIDFDKEKAQEAIISLSQMMDYMLYDSQSSKSLLSEEINFIKGYIDLMKLRLMDDFDLKVEIPDELPQVEVPPLLTISLIENAFKYGVSYNEPSFIHIKYTIDNHQMHFFVSNRIHQHQKKNKGSGIGLVNTEKRLDLLFGDDYSLDFNQENDIFTVNLKIPL